MVDRATHCEVCEAVWRSRAARFCGRCGARLPAPPPTLGARLRAAAPTLTAAAVAVVGLTALVWAWPLQLPTPTSDEVRLDVGADSGDMGADTDVEALRRQIDPDRVRCEPRGCEQWRYAITDVVDLSVGPEHTAVVTAGPDTGPEVRMHHGGSMAWSLDAAQILEATTDAVTGTAAVHVVGDAVAIAATGTLAFVADDGSLRWRVPLDGGVPTAVSSVNDRVVVETDDGGGGERVIAAFDRASGDLVWDHAVTDVHVVDDVAVVVSTTDHGLWALDPVSGAPRWAQATYAGRTPRILGDWVGLSDTFGHYLADPATGERVTSISGVAATDFVELPGGGWATIVTLSDRDRANWTPQRRMPLGRVVAYDADGTFRWSRDFEAAAAPRCCTGVHTDAEHLVAVTGGERLVLDPTTGNVVRHDITSSERARWLADEVEVIRDPGGLYLDDGDAGAVIRPETAAVVSESPWVVADTDEVIGVGLVEGHDVRASDGADGDVGTGDDGPAGGGGGE